MIIVKKIIQKVCQIVLLKLNQLFKEEIRI